MRPVLFILVLCFACVCCVTPQLTHHVQVVLLEAGGEALAGFEETTADSCFKSGHPLHFDGFKPDYFHAYQGPALDTFKQPPRMSV